MNSRVYLHKLKTFVYYFSVVRNNPQTKSRELASLNIVCLFLFKVLLDLENRANSRKKVFFVVIVS